MGVNSQENYAQQGNKYGEKSTVEWQGEWACSCFRMEPHGTAVSKAAEVLSKCSTSQPAVSAIVFLHSKGTNWWLDLMSHVLL